MPPVRRPFVCAVLVVVLLLATTLGHAAGPYTPEETPAQAIVVDALVLRPLGLVATVFGVATFIVSLPFSLPSGSVGYVARKLVVAPAAYTFIRPMGRPE